MGRKRDRAYRKIKKEIEKGISDTFRDVPMYQTYQMSDNELNKILYKNAKISVDKGLAPEMPEDDFGIVLWFTWNFITPDMRKAFPAIASEYLSNVNKSVIPNIESSGELLYGAIDTPSGRMFFNIPYPRMNELTWEDAYYFRVLLMILFSARAGDVYSRDFMIALYKTYYKPEYDRLKRLKTLTYLNLLEFHDDDCLRKGYSSGHNTDGKTSKKDKIIEDREHEPGWTNSLGNRNLSPVPENIISVNSPDIHIDSDNKSMRFLESASVICDIYNAPDEPPMQPTISRLIIMAGLMDISIDPTCNAQILSINEVAGNMNTYMFLLSPELRKSRNDNIDRCIDIFRKSHPEMFSPYEYQKEKKYMALQVAEMLMMDTFRRYDTGFRIPYDSKQFDLSSLVANITVFLSEKLPGIRMSFDELLILAQVQYLSECFCELMNLRENELDDIFKFRRRKNDGELEKTEYCSETDPDNKDTSYNVLSDKFMNTAKKITIRNDDDISEYKENEKNQESDENLKVENEMLKKILADKEMALSEAKQKFILQRTMYEKERDARINLESDISNAAAEHSELIALREFVYNLNSSFSDPALTENTSSRDEIIDKIKNKRVTILGGTEKWTKKMRRLLPTWKFIPVEDNSIGAVNAMEWADCIYIYTDYVKHSQYYRAMNIIKAQNKTLYYLSTSNIDECFKRFENDLCDQSTTHRLT